MIKWTKEREADPEETQKTLMELFDKSDANADGKLNQEEFIALCKNLEVLVRSECGDAVLLTQ